MDYLSLIQTRKSIRSFKNEELTQKEQDEIIDFFYTDCHRLNPDIAVEARIYSGTAGNQLEGIVGYMGYAFHAPHYLVTFAEKCDGMYENAGFMGEDMALKMTEMSVENCWLSVPDGELVKKRLDYPGDKVVTSIMAIGQGNDEKNQVRIDIKSPADVTFTEREGHVAAKIAQVEMVYQDTFMNPVDWDSTVAPSLDEAFYAASLAPSFLNMQEYRYIMGMGKLLLLIRDDEETSDMDEKLDMGATMLNFSVAIEQSRYPDVSWKLGKPADLWDLGDTKGYYVVAYCEI